MKTTFSRTFSTFAVILLAALLLVGISFQLLVRSYLTNKTVEGLKADSSAIADVAAAYYKDITLTNRDFLIILSVVSEISDADTVICDAKGTLILCSDSPLGCEHQGIKFCLRSTLSVPVLWRGFTRTPGTWFPPPSGTAKPAAFWES